MPSADAALPVARSGPPSEETYQPEPTRGAEEDDPSHWCSTWGFTSGAAAGGRPSARSRSPAVSVPCGSIDRWPEAVSVSESVRTGGGAG
jgi:hypothetical protein